MSATAANLKTLDRVCRRALATAEIAPNDRRTIYQAALQVTQEIDALPVLCLTAKRLGKRDLRDFLAWHADHVVAA